jgi:hypothetical protein
MNRFINRYTLSVALTSSIGLIGLYKIYFKKNTNNTQFTQQSNRKRKQPLSLKYFRIETVNESGTSDIHKCISITIYDDKLTNVNKNIGCICYDLIEGNITKFRINPLYRDRGLGKELLHMAVKDIEKEGNVKNVYVNSNDNSFWKNVWNRSWKLSFDDDDNCMYTLPLDVYRNKFPKDN